jgi:hypothetical protein
MTRSVLYASPQVNLYLSCLFTLFLLDQSASDFDIVLTLVHARHSGPGTRLGPPDK